MELYDAIREMPLFESFSEQEKQQFTKADLSVRKYQKGDVIIKEGDKHSSLYLLVKGAVSVIKKKDNPLSSLSAGELFGEMSFLTKKPRYTSIIADEDVLVIRMDNDFFQKISRTMADKIKNYLIELLVSRLDEMNKAMTKIAKFATSRSMSD